MIAFAPSVENGREIRGPGNYKNKFIYIPRNISSLCNRDSTLVIDKVIDELFHFAGKVTQFHQLVKVEEGNDGVLGIKCDVNHLQ